MLKENLVRTIFIDLQHKITMLEIMQIKFVSVSWDCHTAISSNTSRKYVHTDKTPLSINLTRVKKKVLSRKHVYSQEELIPSTSHVQKYNLTTNTENSLGNLSSTEHLFVGQWCSSKLTSKTFPIIGIQASMFNNASPIYKRVRSVLLHFVLLLFKLSWCMWW